MRLRRLPNANEINTKNMKCTCPTQRPNARDPTQASVASGKTQLLGFAGKTRKMCITQCRRYQHVCILASGKAKVSSFASGNAKVPNAISFASQWNIGFRVGNSLFILQIYFKLRGFGITQCYGNLPYNERS